jgi:hypothetical protein
MFVAKLYLMLKFGNVGKYIGSTSKVPKCRAGEEYRRYLDRAFEKLSITLNQERNEHSKYNYINISFLA